MSRTRTSIRRTLPAAAIATAGVLLLAACGTAIGGGDDNVAAEFDGVEPAESITFWSNHPATSMDLEEAMIADFTEETGIEVELVTAGANYDEVSQRFETSQTSGDVGDVVVLSDATWFPSYLNESITPVDPIFEAAGIDTGNFQEALYADYLYEGSYYAVPYARSTPLFYYNRDAYEAAGLTDEAPASWEEVQANGEAIVEAGATESGFAFPEAAQFPAWTMANLVWSYGGAWSDEWDFAPLNGTETTEALTFAQDAVNDGWAQVVSGEPATAFAAGAAGQLVASTGSLAGILDTAEFEVGVGFLPGGPASTQGNVPTGGAGLAIASAAPPERQLAAAMFIDFVTNAENTAFFSEGTGYVPVRTDADMSAVYAEQPLFEVAVEQLAETRSQDFSRVFLPGGDLALATALQDILTTDADVQTTLDALRVDFDEMYERDLAPLLPSE